MRPTFAPRPGLAAAAWLATVATALCLAPIFDSLAYLPPTAMACAVVEVTGVGARALRLPALLAAPVQVVGLGMWAVIVAAPETTVAGVVPTPSSISALVERLGGGMDAASAYIAPAPADPDLVLLVAAGVAASAIVVDLLAAGFRQAPWGGLPLLALYTIPSASVQANVPWWGFAAAASGFLILVAADGHDRLVRWGRSLIPGGTPAGRPGTLARATGSRYSSWVSGHAGARIGMSAVALAVVIPALTPPLGEPVVDLRDPATGDTLAVANPIVDLQRDLNRPEDFDVVTINTPDPDVSYLRVVTLEDYDGTRWQPAERDVVSLAESDGQLPPPPGLSDGVPTQPREYDIAIGDGLDSQWLPLPYPTSEVEIDGDWRFSPDTLDVVSASDLTTADTQYAAVALDVDPTAADLTGAGAPPADVVELYTSLPESFPAEVAGLARQIVGSTTSPYDQALALQQWFREPGRFEYSTDVQPTHAQDALVEFLFDDRSGYCEQFAASMAAMARSLGIPARVSVGFLRPETRTDEAAEHVFSIHDVHAWPEVYFEGVGWVLFEPTPSIRTGEPPPYAQDASGQPEDAPAPVPPPAPAPAPSPGAGVDPGEQADPDVGDEGDSDESGAGWSRWWDVIAWIVAAVALALAPCAARTILRRQRWSRAVSPAQVAEAAWSEVRDVVLDLWPGGRLASISDAVSPRRAAQGVARVIESDPAATAAWARIVDRVERARFAASSGDPGGLSDDCAAVTAALGVRAGRARRTLATFLPASLIRTVTVAGRRLRDSVRRRPPQVRVEAQRT